MRAVASEVGRRTSCTCSEFGEEDIGHAARGSSHYRQETVPGKTQYTHATGGDNRARSRSR